MNPLVSIITPTYNHEKYITECIQSVKNQTYQNWEMLIVDDGSTDNTFGIASKLAASDKRIKVFTQQNKGIFKLAETYNLALQMSDGSYIAVLEGDDVWFEDKLQLQIQALEDDKSCVLCWGQAYSSSHDLKTDFELMPQKISNESIYFNTPIRSALEALVFNNPLPALTVVLRKTTLIEIGGFQQKYNLPLVDMPTWQELACKGVFCYINRPLGKWRNSLNQATKTFNIQMIEGLCLLAKDLHSHNLFFFNSKKISLKNIESYFNSRLVVNHYKLGLYSLKRNDNEKAIEEFMASIRTKSFQKINWKFKAIYKIIFAILPTYKRHY